MAFMDYVKLYRVKGTEAWGKLPTRQRWIYGGIGATILIGFTLLIASFGSGEGGMVTLKSFVSDPAAAQRRLAMFHIKSEFNETDKNVSVAKADEQKAVLILGSAKMLPNAKTAYGFLNETDLTQTDARMQEAIRTTLEEILSETIAAYPFVGQAEVRIAPPYRGWNWHPNDNENKAKASVSVELVDQDSLGDEQVVSIAQMVSFAYPSLPPENVAITDMSGRPYRYSTDWIGIVDTMKMRKYEQDQIREKVEHIMGDYRPKVSATVFIQTGKREKGERDVPIVVDGAVSTQERSEKEISTKKLGSAGAIGEIGPAARDDPAMAEIISERTLEEGKSDPIVGTRTDFVTDSSLVPVMDKSNVAVVIDKKFKDEVTPEIPNWIKSISTTTGIPELNVSINFAPMPQPMGAGSGTLDGILATILKPENLVKIVLLVLAVGAFVALMLMLKKSAPKPLTLVDENLGDEEAEPMPEVPFLPPVNQLEGNVVREKVVELVRKNPKAAANLVKRWILFGK